MSNNKGPLSGIKVIDCSLLVPGLTASHFADLGAEVIKVESPGGDYGRILTWPIIQGESQVHHHVSRGKKSIVIDLRKEEGQQIFLDLVKDADVVVEAMRPGALEKRGVGYEAMKAVNPAIVFCSISGYGMTGPYRNVPAHGVAFDSWAGWVKPEYDDEGFCYIPEHASTGIHAGPAFAVIGMLAALVRAKTTGEGAFVETGQADSAAYMDWLRIETWRAYERPEDEVTGNKSDNYERRAPGTAGMEHGVRYQFYESANGHILFMASEQEFWKNFCEGVDRMDLFERWPGNKYGDHAKNNRELQAILRDIFRTKTTNEWMEFGVKWNTTLAPVNTPKTIADDPHFQDRFKWYHHSEHVTDMVSYPVHFVGEELPIPTVAPKVAEHSNEILESLGYDAEKILALQESGALG